MVPGEVTRSLLGSLLALSVIVVATYLIKAAVGYVVWAVRDSATDVGTTVDALPEDIDRGSKRKVVDGDRITATRFSTLPPRWVVSSTAVETLDRDELECLISHVSSHVRSHGRAIHNVAIGVGVVLVLAAPRIGAAFPPGLNRLLPVAGFLPAVGYFAVCLPVIERWLVYRADRRAAANCGRGMYLEFLETKTRVDPSRAVWQRWLEPTPERRLEKLRARVSAE
jgi:hypothetical protein